MDKDKKYFKVDEKVYFVERATSTTLEEADQIYARNMKDSIANARKGEKILLRSQLDEFLRDQGIWTLADEAEVLALQNEYEELETKQKRGGIKLSEGRENAINMLQITRKIANLSERRRAFDYSTAESLAENEQNDYVIYACTYSEETGQRCWNSFEDMKEDKDSERYAEAQKSHIILHYGEGATRPEVDWLKKYGFVNEDLTLIDRKTGEVVDLDGNPVKEYEESEEEFSPFIDDETGEPIDLSPKKKSTKKVAKRKKKVIKPE